MITRQKKENIPLLNPLHFKEEWIDDNWTPATKQTVNDFFIHSYKDEIVPLKLPLPLHKKTVNDFTLITGGTVVKTIGTETYTLKANQFLFTPKNSITTTKNISSDLEGFYCHFSDDFVANPLFLRPWHTQQELQSPIPLKKEEIEIGLSLLKRMTLLYRNIKDKPENFKLLHYYLSTLMAEVFVFSEKELIKITTHPLVWRFRNLVTKHFKISKNVRFYANLLNVTPNHLNKVIKTETGKSASATIYNICILEAKVLLLQTGLDISEIAYELGFDDVSYFSKFFKKHALLSPRMYRKMIDKYK